MASLVVIFDVSSLPVGVYFIWQLHVTRRKLHEPSHLTWDGKKIGENVSFASESHDYGGCLLDGSESVHHFSSMYDIYETRYI